MALSMMKPNSASKEDLNKCGIGALIDMDVSNMHVAIAVCIDGGPVSQEEQRTITTIVDEVVFDLRRSGADWAKNTAILIVRFPDSESFVNSLNGQRNLVRATSRFPTRQRDECKWKNETYTMGLAWEAPVQAQPVPADHGASMLRAEMTIEKVLTVHKPMAKTSDTAGVNRMTGANCPIEQAVTSVGFSALQAYAYGGYADAEDVMLKDHSSQRYLNTVKTPAQITPLLFAAQSGSYDTAKMLLEQGVSVNKGRDDGQTPLYGASRGGNKAIVEMLAECGADVHKPANDGSTPLFIAAQHGQSDVVDYLIGKKADMNTPMPSGLPPIGIAAQMQKGETVKLLARAKAELNKCGKSGETALFKAAAQNMPDVVKFLVQCKADSNLANSQGQTPLQKAQEWKFTDVVEALG